MASQWMLLVLIAIDHAEKRVCLLVIRNDGSLSLDPGFTDPDSWSWSLILAINHAEEGSNYEEGERSICMSCGWNDFSSAVTIPTPLISNIHRCGKEIETFQRLATFPRDLHFGRGWVYNIWQTRKVNLGTIYLFSCGLVFDQIWCCVFRLFSYAINLHCSSTWKCVKKTNISWGKSEQRRK